MEAKAEVFSRVQAGSCERRGARTIAVLVAGIRDGEAVAY